MANKIEPIEACLLISRRDIKRALKKTRCADSSGPRGLAVYITPKKNQTSEAKRIIDPSRIKLLSVYYRNGKLRGKNIKNIKMKVVRLDGSDCTDNDIPVWEHSHCIEMDERPSRAGDEPKKIDFKFSFFQYDMLRIVLKKLKEEELKINTKSKSKSKSKTRPNVEDFLIGSIQMNLGTDGTRVRSASVLYGDSFDLKMEPFLSNEDKPFLDDFNLGFPPFVVGFGCRKNWNKGEGTKNALAPIFADYMDEFVKGIERIAGD